MKFLGRTNSRILAMMIIYNYDINKDIDQVYDEFVERHENDNHHQAQYTILFGGNKSLI